MVRSREFPARRARIRSRTLAGHDHTGKSDTVDLALFGVGWILGWLLLWRLRPLPTTGTDSGRTTGRAAVAVVVPARNEASSLPHLLPGLVAQMRPGDELVVVDDHSTDSTTEVAAHLGARVVCPPALPADWLGKPHACWTGTRSTTAPLLLFVDADVRPAPDLLDRVALAVSLHPGDVVSVQPWHDTGSWIEQASLLANVTALMGSGDPSAVNFVRRRATANFTRSVPTHEPSSQACCSSCSAERVWFGWRRNVVRRRNSRGVTASSAPSL